MNDIAKVFVTGRLTKDMELKYLPSGTAMGSFSIAFNESVKNGEQWAEKANFIDCTFFGKMAESLQKYLLKGQAVCISGRLTQDRWEDNKTGEKKSKHKIVVENLRLMGGKGEQSQNEQSNPQANTGEPQWQGESALVPQSNGYAQTYPQGQFAQTGQQQYGAYNNAPIPPYNGADEFPEDIPF